MEIQIGDYKIARLDERNIGVKRLRKDSLDKDGNPRWDNIQYHGTILNAVKGLSDLVVGEADANSVSALRDELEAFHRQLSASIKGVEL